MKGDKENYPVSLIWFLVAILFFVAWINTAFGDDRTWQSNDMNAQTAGDVDTSSKSFGFAHALGDVDINQCMGSTQWGSIIVSKQKLVLNKWCAAEVYDAKGLFDMGARMRCLIPEIAELFTTELECLAANTAYLVQEVVVEDNFEEEEEWHDEQMAMQASYDQRIDRLEQLATRAPAKTQIIREEAKPWMTDEKRAKLEAVLAE